MILIFLQSLTGDSAVRFIQCPLVLTCKSMKGGSGAKQMGKNSVGQKGKKPQNAPLNKGADDGSDQKLTALFQ